MPLDTRKLQHMLQVQARSFAGRQRTLVVVALVAGSYTCTPVQGIFKLLENSEPTVLRADGDVLSREIDALLIVPAGTLMTGAVYIADTSSPTSGAVSAAAKYEPLTVLPARGGASNSHLLITLRRLR